ncbi:hypothetical protein EYB26_003131 [Talaromyces marneffei]|uniref:uncharacterized protein n=1 Tax=Talaromyces marneffei TaxID=37727 RepID=UPI0012A8F4CD|nr:uncharacterized protein EYB26_003131 [Talaromyces marneffei]QGA15473.1 hypothetical protein EYB26_003131 [Talaromyces marneffei]
MNPTSSIPAGSSLWQEARNADGRVYYYNVQTKVTQWEKPADLLTPVERALSRQPWKEYTAEGGRKYWYNTQTKQSTWEMPEVYKTALAQGPTQPSAPAPVAGVAPTFVAGGTTSFLPYGQHQRDRDDNDRSGLDRRQGYMGMEANGLVTSQQTDPEYSSFEEAESVFIKLLRRCNVQPDWSWEQAMRATIKDPQYRALKDPKDRRAAFDKFAAEVRMQERDRAKERFAKLRTDFYTMLKSHPEIKHYSRWKSIRPIIEGETIFRSTNDENERRQLFEEYILDLKKAHVEQEAVTRKAAMDELVNILKALELEPYARWSEVQNALQANERIQNDDKFKTLSKSDILTAFENHIKSLERTFNDARQQHKAAKARRERHSREKYLELLKELRSQGKIKAGAKWMQIHPLIQDDPRYVAMLGQSGSSPLDLFWDMVEEEERGLRGPRNDVLDVLDDKRYEITTKTTYEEFASIMATDRRTADIDTDILHLIFQRAQEKAQRRSEDEKHAADRHQRRAVDALRSRIKHLEPPVRLGDTWEQVQPRVEKFEEYTALESEDLRLSAFEKFMRRLKEKEDDAERDRDRDRGSRRGDHHERPDRDSRNGSYRSDRRVRSSRTPDPDPYEADRRKAQADRERSYRKVSGLSPVRERRDDRDRTHDKERERDRDRDRRGVSHYDRERRSREEERERLYRTRGDPRGSRDELDYGGDTRSTVSSDRRRRRDSDAESVASRSAKRYRRDEREKERSRDRSHRDRESGRTPAIEEEPKAEEKAVHSGSEEGEIEED